MIKKILLIQMLLFSVVSWGQKAIQTTATLSKQTVPAFTNSYEIRSDDLEQILEDYFVKEKKFKRLKGQGYIQYKGVSWNEVNQEKMDIYYEVNGKKKNSTVTFIISKGYDNFISTENDPATANALIQFLNNFQTQIDKSNKEKRIEEQKEIIEKEEDRLKDLNKEKSRLEEKIKDATEDLNKLNQKMKEQQDKLNNAKNELTQINK